jgi:hypothetical protein
MLLRLSALIEAPRLRRTGRKGYGFGDVGLLIRGFTYKSSEPIAAKIDDYH